ncbi:MAG: thiamine phosphate synthase [gamma proteobacterium symbiont of Bathyaustriella thionipta]|nr:thiamine phosphate synthase [gamma proteobacterium symbiont of Bathyaustriella thionipta]MCU7951126.1 thiamine phosphate synthase [gamma proteobacterium symbiont of Bathyaustriella thionipta]MCU7954549.1 thiamine phosphate synthase [gamma proteobacterium symbiont of Bathyaustriella thionipta]MCU7957641.1 thiamine phosphate synthase [gamma proteobacterium symbiont of Bathyaustriella thionipta]MCU7966906.1 thiamine phosphate synthase [gamma proteobacterium symbiont of Bathyaustriella thionipta
MNNRIESLPDRYMMTGKFNDPDEFKNKLTNALSDNNKVVQFRQKNIEDSDYLALVKVAESVCKQFNSCLLLGTSVDIYAQANADGLHLNSQVLFEYEDRPVSDQHLLSVSCHNLKEMQQAEKLGADILLLSPVKATASHPELNAIGWQQFSQMIERVKCPVYALGGMRASDLAEAKYAGAKGIAVSSFWQ